jgi:geranylgeranyl pyrophosphate synthase
MACLRSDRDLDLLSDDSVFGASAPLDIFLANAPAVPGVAEILKALMEYAPLHADIEKTLGKVIQSAVANPGAAIRYRLTYLTAIAHGLSAREALPLACAVEYFHLASLLFDDLPVMDDAMERRGRICLHLLHGESTVILGALALITRAYSLIGQAIEGAPREARVGAHAQAEQCLGSAGILNGQAHDLKFKPSSPAAIAIAMGKTVPLVTMAMTIPALLGAAPEGHIRLLRRLSLYWGLYYQGLDDLTDLLERADISGKTPGRDAALGRPNIAHQLGMARTYGYLHRLARLADNCIVEISEGHPQSHFLFTFQTAFLNRLESLPV